MLFRGCKSLGLFFIIGVCLFVPELQAENYIFQNSFLIPPMLDLSYDTYTIENGVVLRPDENNQQPVNINPNIGSSKNGAYFCGKHFLTTPQKHDGSKRQIMVSTKYGFNMYVDSEDKYVSVKIMQQGTFDQIYISLMGKLVKEGDNILNLGSQSGLQALVLTKIVGPTGKIFIFEPYSFSNYLVTKNFELNNISQYAKIYKVGASDNKTKGVIRISFANTGGAMIQEQKQNMNSKNYGQNVNEEIDIDLVDNVVPKDVKFNFALLDVEQHQIPALYGMKKLIQRSPDLILMVQWQYLGNKNRERGRTVQFLGFMIQRGYRFYTYGGGDFQVRCTVGTFTQQFIEGLLQIKFGDVFMFPAHIPLPKQ